MIDLTTDEEEEEPKIKKRRGFVWVRSFDGLWTQLVKEIEVKRDIWGEHLDRPYVPSVSYLCELFNRLTEEDQRAFIGRMRDRIAEVTGDRSNDGRGTRKESVP